MRLIEPGAFTKVSALGVEEQRVRVLIGLGSPAEQWRALGDGYHMGVRILTRAPGERLTVPVGAVFPLAEGGVALFVVEDGRARQRPVSVLARNAELAWIAPGPAAGSAVVVYPPTQLRDGARVRLRSGL